MARPCGCGDTCNCVIADGHGTDVAGAGTNANPYIIDFDGSEVIDQGLTWNSGTRKLSTKLAFGGGIEFDSTGAMRTTGDSPDGGPIDLVAPLEGREPGMVACGMMGAGNLISPESFLRSYEYGLGLGIDMMHVSVRYLHDGTPVVIWDERLGRTVYHPYNVNVNHWIARRVEDQFPHFWRTLPHPAGMEDGILPWQPHGGQDPLPRTSWEPARMHPFAPVFGWFGYMEPPQLFGVFLSQVLELCQNRMPLVLHLQFPSTIQDPQTSPAWRSSLFLSSLRRLIQLYRMQQQVVMTVANTDLLIPGDGGPDVDVLEYFRDVVRVGPILPTGASMTENPPESFAPRGWTWAMVRANATQAELNGYADAGIHQLVSPVNRQQVYKDVVLPGRALGFVSGDPIYIGGAMAQGTHPIAHHGYRTNKPQFRDHKVLNGLINPYDTDVTKQGARMRGTVHIEPNSDLQNQMYFNQSDMGDPPWGGRSYWVNHGWATPWVNLTDWSANFHFQMDNPGWTGTVSDWMGFAFCIPADHGFIDWGDDVEKPDRGYDTGYAFYMAQNSQCYLTRYVNGARTGSTLFTMLTGTQPGRSGRKQFRVCVSDTRGGIRICAVTDTALVTLVTLTGPEFMHRGGYIYFGRYSLTDANWVGRVIEPEIRWGQGTADWDAAIPR